MTDPLHDDLGENQTQAGNQTEAGSAPEEETSSVLAYGDEAEEEAQPHRSWRWTLVWASCLLVVGLAGAGVWIVVQSPSHKPPAGAPPAAVLDGTYRVESEWTKQTQNGAPSPGPNENTWWAFRSSCTSTGCVATGTKLDANNHQAASTPAHTAELHFVDGSWQRTPVQVQIQHPRCLGADGKSVVAGADTEMAAWSLEPQPGGTLRGVLTETVITNECGFQGAVTQGPLSATRTGDVPASVTVADPATVPAAPPTNPALAPLFGGPVLEGTFRVDYDQAHETANGAPTTGTDPGFSEWWAFHSSCTTSDCVATGSRLVDTNHQAAAGVPWVLHFHFADSHWQTTPYLRPPEPCGGTNGPVTDTSTASWSLDSRPDGTLRGVQTVTVLTNECGLQGLVFRTPMVVTRVGDVPPPPGVILPDPTLFMAPPAPATPEPERPTKSVDH